MLTVFVDASHCPSTRAAGYGAWAKGDGWVRGTTFGGPLPVETNNSSEAEIVAMAAALQVLADGDCFKYPTVMLQTDNLRTLQLIRQNLPRCRATNHKDSAPIPDQRVYPSPTENKALRIIHAILHQLDVYVRHVRGHKEGDGRNWVNRTCDEIAKRHMRHQRDQRRGPKKEKTK